MQNIGQAIDEKRKWRTKRRTGIQKAWKITLLPVGWLLSKCHLSCRTLHGSKLLIFSGSHCYVSRASHFETKSIQLKYTAPVPYILFPNCAARIVWIYQKYFVVYVLCLGCFAFILKMARELYYDELLSHQMK